MEKFKKKKEVYSYKNYLVYKHSPYNSTYVNINKDGIRLNKSSLIQSDKETYTIWLIGSSAVFGVSNSDGETLSSYLENFLNNSDTNKNFIVQNLGVVAYTSLQDYLHFKTRLINSKPDMVLIYNGLMDHYNAWQYKGSLEKKLLYTGIYSHVLPVYWDMHANKKLINLTALSTILKDDIFNNTIKLINLAKKWFLIKKSNNDINSWKKNYTYLKENSLKESKKYVPKAINFYLENQLAIFRLANDNNIDVIFAQQPMIYTTTKPLLDHETLESQSAKYFFFAMEDEELDKLDTVKSYRVKQTQYWDLDYFVKTYKDQNVSLKKLANDLDAGYIDITGWVNKAGDRSIFSSQAHYTFEGAEYLASGIAPYIINRLKK